MLALVHDMRPDDLMLLLNRGCAAGPFIYSLFLPHSSIMCRFMRGALPLLLLSLASGSTALLRGAELPALKNQVRREPLLVV